MAFAFFAVLVQLVQLAGSFARTTAKRFGAAFSTDQPNNGFLVFQYPEHAQGDAAEAPDDLPDPIPNYPANTVCVYAATFDLVAKTSTPGAEVFRAQFVHAYLAGYLGDFPVPEGFRNPDTNNLAFLFHSQALDCHPAGVIMRIDGVWSTCGEAFGMDPLPAEWRPDLA